MRNSLMTAVAVLAAVLIAGCGREVSNGDLPTLSQNGKASLHRLKSEELKAAMHDLNTLVFERLYSEIDRDEMRIRYSKEIATMAESMARDIKTIKRTGRLLEMSDDERKIFLSLAEELEKEGQILNRVAESHQTEAIQPAMDRLVSVCNRCHKNFREVE